MALRFRYFSPPPPPPLTHDNREPYNAHIIILYTYCTCAYYIIRTTNVTATGTMGQKVDAYVYYICSYYLPPVDKLLRLLSEIFCDKSYSPPSSLPRHITNVISSAEQIRRQQLRQITILYYIRTYYQYMQRRFSCTYVQYIARLQQQIRCHMKANKRNKTLAIFIKYNILHAVILSTKSPNPE